MSPWSRPKGSRSPQVACHPPRALPTFLATLGLTLLIGVGLTGALPGAAEAGLCVEPKPSPCPIDANIDVTTQHKLLLPPESYQVRATISTPGEIGVLKNVFAFASIHRFRFELDCDPDNALFVGCSNTGNSPAEINYDGDVHIAVDGSCVDRLGNQLEVMSNVPAGGSAINQIIFTFVSIGLVPTPLFLNENDFTGCSVSFQVTVLAHDDSLSPGTVDRIEHVLGFDATQSDAVCSTGFATPPPIIGVSHSAHSEFILLCPACDVHGRCAGRR